MIGHVDGGTVTGTLAADAPVVGWAEGPLGAVQAAAREMARQAALRARAVAAFAATRPATTDRQQGERGAMAAERWAARAEVLRPVSEWAAHELSIALNTTAQAAEAELERSLTLVQRLPRALDALQAGLLHERHLWCLLEHVAPIADDALRARVEAELLEWVAARHRVTTPAGLADRVRRVVSKHNARDAARDLARALAQRGISLRPERTVGMSAVTIVCTTPEAQAFYRALSACVDALETDPEDTRTRGQKTVDCLMDLVLRPGETDLPPVQALLTIVASVQTALGGDGLGEVDGELVSAEMVRQLARALAGPSPQPTSDAATPGTTGGRQPGAVSDTAADPVVTGSGATGRRLDLPPGEEPIDTDGGPIDRAAAELGSKDFDRWLDDLVRAAFGDAPAPGDTGWSPGRPPDSAEWDTGPWGDRGDAVGLEEPGSAAPAAPSSDAAPSPDGTTPPGDGWWAAADRAVEEAGTAVHGARLALGAAERMVRTAQRADAADETAWQVSPAGRVNAAPDALTALAGAADSQREELAALLMTTAGGGLADRPRIAVTDATTGALLALTDLPGLRRAGTCGAPACHRRPESCDHDLTGRPGLGAAGPSPGHRPETALDRYGRARDRHCRFPGCRRRIPKAGELDHGVAHPHGPTAAANLAGFCTADHRGKHQAPGWTYRLRPDGTLTVTTPTGLTAVTEPPPY
jgi:hypothetical protein